MTRFSIRQRRRAGLALPVLAAVTLTGCLNASFEATVEEDGAGSMQFTYLFDLEAFGALAAMFGGDAPADDELCAELLTEMEGVDPATAAADEATEVEVDVINAGGDCGVRYATTWATPEEFTERFSAVGNDLNEEAGSGSARATLIATDDGGWRIEMVLPPSEVDSNEDLSMVTELLGGIGEPPQFTFSISMPGSVIDHNGDSVDGSTVNWTWDILDPEFSANEQRLFAESAPKAAGGGPGVVFLLGAAAMGAVIGFLALRSRRGGGRGGEPAAVGAPVVPAAPVAPTPGPSVPSVPPGWYPDPAGQAPSRWWDGTTWTDATSG